MKKVLIILMCMVMCVGFTACKPTDNGGGGGGGGGTTPSGKTKVVVSLPVNSVNGAAWRTMASDYNSKYGTSKNTIVNIEPNSDAASYQQKLMTSLSAGPDKVTADIVVGNEAAQYFKTHFVDYTSHLNKPNPYIENNKRWKDGLEEIATNSFGADNSQYTLSFDTTQVFFVYKKEAFANAGIEGTPKNWDELIAACEKLKKTEAPGSNGKMYIPMVYGGNKKSTEMPIGWLMRIYMDQYFKDYVEQSHAKADDYCYDPEVDATWEYKPNFDDYTGTEAEKRVAAVNNDSPSDYTANVLRAYNYYFDSSNENNHKSARFTDLLTNLERLFATENGFINPIPTDYENALSLFHQGEGAMAIVATDFFAQYARENGMQADIAGVFDQVGMFYAPPMTKTAEAPANAAPEVNYTRSLGGPNGFLAVLNKDTVKVNAAMDFLMYVFSPQGQKVRLDSFVENKGTLSGPLLVKGVEIPAKLQIVLDQLKSVEDPNFYYGESDFNPVNMFVTCLKESSNGMYDPASLEIYKDVMHSFLVANDKGVRSTAKATGEAIFNAINSNKTSFFTKIGFRSDCLDNPHQNPKVS